MACMGRMVMNRRLGRVSNNKDSEQRIMPEDIYKGMVDAGYQIVFPDPVDIPPCDFFPVKTSKKINQDSK